MPAFTIQDYREVMKAIMRLIESELRQRFPEATEDDKATTTVRTLLLLQLASLDGAQAVRHTGGR